jgi:hypothetical protein
VTRYLFHFHDGVDQPDLTGTEFANSTAARDAAVVFMGEKLKELGGDFWPDLEVAYIDRNAGPTSRRIARPT